MVYSDGRTADPVYMQEYQALKDSILSTTRKAGGGFAAYLLFTVSGTAALCALIGSAASNLYLLLLFRDVDLVTGEDKVALWEADYIENPLVRAFAKFIAAYSHALKPRLLVLVGLGAITAAINQFPESGVQVDLLHQSCLLGGFLTYKTPLILKIIDENTPKTFRGDEMSRPLIDKFDPELDLDQWGRPRKSVIGTSAEEPLTGPDEATGVEQEVDASAQPGVLQQTLDAIENRTERPKRR